MGYISDWDDAVYERDKAQAERDALRAENGVLRAECWRLWLDYHDERCHKPWPHPLPCLYLTDTVAALIASEAKDGNR